MKKRIIVSLLMLTATLTTQAQSGTTKASKPKTARTTAASNPVIDSASNAGATNDGASGQSGRPMAIPSSSTSQGTSTQRTSTQNQVRSSQKIKKRTRSDS